MNELKKVKSSFDNKLIFFEKRIIPRDDNQKYMIRFTIFECKWISFKVHKFLMSDDQCLHDHPWSFISFILKTGYVEITPTGRNILPPFPVNGLKYERIKAGRVIYRSAHHIHRVELLHTNEIIMCDVNGEMKPFKKELPAWTFVISFKRIRKWGFFTRTGWMHWKKYAELIKGGKGGELC